MKQRVRKNKRRTKKNHDEHMDESWLLPYSDLVTLLLALFIALYASSNVDADKFKQLSDTFQSIFQSGSGVMNYPEVNPPTDEPNVGKTSEKVEEETDEELKKEMQEKLEQDKVLQSVEQKFTGYIKENKLEDKLQTSFTPEGLLITIKSNVLFESGSASIQRKQMKIVDEISEILVSKPPLDVVISGHTDTVPISNSQFSSNWALSTARAVNFLESMLENTDLEPNRFSAKGFGEHRPIGNNDTEKGRSKNRRVEILVLPQGQSDYSVDLSDQNNH